MDSVLEVNSDGVSKTDTIIELRTFHNAYHNEEDYRRQGLKTLEFIKKSKKRWCEAFLLDPEFTRVQKIELRTAKGSWARIPTLRPILFKNIDLEEELVAYTFQIIILMLVCFISTAAKASQKNIILILSDDQSWAGLSVMMDPDVKHSISLYDETPNLELLAAEGARFTNAYAPSPVCSPSRISIQTGKTPARLNWTKAAPFISDDNGQYLIPPHHDKNIASAEITIGEMLKTADYKTAHFGKWHLLGGGPQSHGYDVSDGDIGNKYAAKFSDPNPVDLFGMIERAKKFINESQQENKTFYLQLSFHALHYPENALNDTIKKYDQKYPDSLQEIEIQRLALNENMDEAIGRLLGYLEAKNITKDTFIIYMADNGAFRRFSSLRGGKGALWEGGIRVPFIIKGPGIPKNTINHFPIVGYDLFPTFMSIAGLKDYPEYLDGINIIDTFDALYKPSSRRNEGLIFHFPHYQKNQKPASAIIIDNIKLIKHYGQGQDMLFDLSNDISEQDNLVDKKPKIYRSLLTKLERYLESVGASMPLLNPNFDPNSIMGPEKRKRR